MIFPGSRFDRCRGQVETASSLLSQLKDERQRLLADPEFAHQKLNEMLGAGVIDLAEVIDLMGNGEPDEAGRLQGEGELVVRKVIDPRITIYRHSLLDGLHKLKESPSCARPRPRPSIGGGHHPGRGPSRERRRHVGTRASPASADDGLADLHRRCPRCGGALRPLLPSPHWRCERCAERIWEQMVQHELARVLAEADRITRWAAS